MDKERERYILELLIATELDMPSLYMGGPSLPSRNKARRILEILTTNGIELNVPEEFAL